MAYKKLRLSLRKVIHAGHFKYYSMRKGATVWESLYVAGKMVMGDTVYARDVIRFVSTAYPTRGA